MNLTQTVTWIPVEERLPQCGKLVFIAADNGNRAIGYRMEDGWRYSPHRTIDQPLFGKATHWAEPIKHPKDL